MARKSKLTEKQWDEILDRHLNNNESYSSLARAFGVSETAVRKKISSNAKQIKTVANQLVKAETSFEKLSISSKMKVRTLADSLKAASRHLASAAEHGAKTADRLLKIASRQVEEMDEDTPDIERLKAASALAKTANDAAAISMNLVKADAVLVGAPEDDGTEIPTVSEFEEISRRLLKEI